MTPEPRRPAVLRKSLFLGAVGLTAGALGVAMFVTTPSGPSKVRLRAASAGPVAPLGFTSTPTATFAVGVEGTFQGAVNHADATLTESGALPPGTRFAQGANGTALIFGTPSAGSGGAYPITLTATSPAGAIIRQNLTVTVDQRPEFHGSSDIWGVALVHLRDVIRTTGYPKPSLTMSGGVLPKGLAFSDDQDGTATISGSPSVSGDGVSGPWDLTKLVYRSVDVEVTATNSAGSATMTLTVHVFLT